MRNGLKNILATAVVAMTVAGFAATASAAGTVEINLYGASAQYFYWNDVADNFLATQYSCGTVEQAQDAGKKNGITRGTSCSPGGDTTYIIRYSSKASFDGIDAQKGRDDYAGLDEKCAEGAPGVPAGKAKFYRQMADESTVDWTSKSVSTRKCVDVTLGASDVAASTFLQTSSGREKPCTATNTKTISRTFGGLNASGLTTYKPLVVPFAFYVNDTALPTVTNLTRLQAVMIYADFVKKWNDFGPSYPDKTVVKCARHAGSGTHATLDAAVMRGDYNLFTAPGTLGGKIKFFNDGSGDLMNCVQQNGCPGYSTGTHGAVGYADADQDLASYVDVAQILYQGAAASKDNIKNGVYDFWSNQWLYEDPTETTYATTHPVVTALMNYASIASNLPTGKAPFWATSNEMKVTKTNDFALPKF